LKEVHVAHRAEIEGKNIKKDAEYKDRNDGASYVAKPKRHETKTSYPDPGRGACP
jgi:hypothetical protein